MWTGDGTKRKFCCLGECAPEVANAENRAGRIRTNSRQNSDIRGWPGASFRQSWMTDILISGGTNIKISRGQTAALVGASGRFDTDVGDQGVQVSVGRNNELSSLAPFFVTPRYCCLMGN
ncbi:hypothetical protein ON010_g9552 [Phytophthora cinnamomi]|nr:hypothetical protein ON010_g9552 [Phytophthora cinnamomi]